MLYVLVYYLLVNIICFFLMGSDKKRAIRGEWRIKESTLWLFALLGGAIGGYIAMKVYRHKTKHTSFTVFFPLIAIGHIILLVYLTISLA
ncbi:DUF1294 domain-containing protein [Metabacillus halosaccharovorans]|uniref:DUF1294 domain-containing protein n=1 Tax=Metabacillus halosaccharovorans TaxID=930124 RepID=A0ABT3DDL9_9BACI|nr:DUF1294 domain-containing protein [Metabacillus halosaccharovorans]MCV9885154.1 DUF1294 domain-containing protein [Metabacillus halosaccharovorans]